MRIFSAIQEAWKVRVGRVQMVVWEGKYQGLEEVLRAA